MEPGAAQASMAWQPGGGAAIEYITRTAHSAALIVSGTGYNVDHLAARRRRERQRREAGGLLLDHLRETETVGLTTRTSRYGSFTMSSTGYILMAGA